MKTAYPFYEIKHEFQTIQQLIDLAGNAYQGHDAFRFLQDGTVQSKTYEELRQDTQAAGQYLVSRFPAKSHIAVVGPTSYEWVVGWLSCVTAGFVAVPLDRMLPVAELTALLRQAEASVLLFDAAHSALAQTVRTEFPQLCCICLNVSFEGELSFFEQIVAVKKNRPLCWASFPKETDVAEIVFTSGTTGSYKGCMLTQQNLAWNAMNGSSYVALTPADKTMSILPVHHTLEITAGLLTPFCSGVTICINDNLRHIQSNLNRYRPECMIAVPMVVEMLYKNIWMTAKKTGQEKKLRAALTLSKALRKLHIHLERVLFKSVLDKLGGSLRLLVVGGAYLDPVLPVEFSAMGITIVQGYGVTECGPVVACNTDRKWKADSVGQPVTGCRVKIVEDEIWVSGPIVMQGYYKDDAANKQAFDGAWYKTGDLGRLDENGYLYLTGRKKNLIILSNGENVSPEELEQKIAQLPGVLEVVVSGQKNTLTAEIYPDRGVTKQTLEVGIAALNKTLPDYKAIRKIEIRDEPFPKTTTQKIRRSYSTAV